MHAVSPTRLLVAAATAALLACASGCASHGSVGGTGPLAANSTPVSTSAAPEPPADVAIEVPNDAIVAIHRSKCGSCHTRVEPGSVTRATAESAMHRHRRRAKLSEREWEEMVDFLSADGTTHARPTARIP